MPDQDSAFVGTSGEQYAIEWLKTNHFSIRHSNYRTKAGEIDIIAEKDGRIHFIEVKTSWYRPDSAFAPEVRVNERKQHKLKLICADFMARTFQNTEKHWQIDVISAILKPDGSILGIEYFPSAVHG